MKKPTLLTMIVSFTIVPAVIVTGIFAYRSVVIRPRQRVEATKNLEGAATALAHEDYVDAHGKLETAARLSEREDMLTVHAVSLLLLGYVQVQEGKISDAERTYLNLILSNPVYFGWRPDIRLKNMGAAHAAQQRIEQRIEQRFRHKYVQSANTFIAIMSRFARTTETDIASIVDLRDIKHYADEMMKSEAAVRPAYATFSTALVPPEYKVVNARISQAYSLFVRFRDVEKTWGKKWSEASEKVEGFEAMAEESHVLQDEWRGLLSGLRAEVDAAPQPFSERDIPSALLAGEVALKAEAAPQPFSERDIPALLAAEVALRAEAAPQPFRVEAWSDALKWSRRRGDF